MEKLGVETDVGKEKTASTEKVCPQCGSKLSSSDEVNVPKCEKCGTEPFEKSDDDTKA